MLNLYFYPGLFGLGLAVGVLGLVFLLSLIVSYAYSECTLLALASYMALMVMVSFVLLQTGVAERLVQQTVLVTGATMALTAQIWLMQGRTAETVFRTALVLTVLSGMVLITLLAISLPHWLVQAVSYVWSAAVLTLSTYILVKQRATVGPWILWFWFGTLASLGAATVFLSVQVKVEHAYWPQVLMLMLQAPPLYLALVWRSRLLNESRLRIAFANVIDPLTGLSTSAVLLERIMRVASRPSKTRTINALFLIEVQNWQALLTDLGDEFDEKLLLEAALRLRRSIGNNDLAARMSKGRFAVVAQGLAGNIEINTLASRLLVSGLRIDSPVMTGIELKFRIVVSRLEADLAPDLNATKIWLQQLTENFSHWPSSHRSRNILLVPTNTHKAATASDKSPDTGSKAMLDIPHQS